MLKNLNYLVLASLMVLIIFITGCDDNANNNPDKRLTNNMAAKFSGDFIEDFKAASFYYSIIKGKYSVITEFQGWDTTKPSISIQFSFENLNDGPNKYSLNNKNPVATVIFNPDSISYVYFSNSGEVNLTRNDDAAIAGTFSFIAFNKDSTLQIRVTDGEFTIMK